MKYTKFIIDTIDRKKLNQKIFESLNWERLLMIASFNRILLEFAKSLETSNIELTQKQQKDIKEIIRQGNKKLKIFKNTLDILEEVSKKSNIPFLYVKTYKFVDYVTFDVDFLVPYKDFNNVLKALEKANIKVTPHPRKQGLHQRNCFYPGCLKMDLHRYFYWQGLDHIDLDFVWENTQIQKLAGKPVPVPSFEADLILNLKQFVYEKMYISLMDFLAIKKAYYKELNVESIVKQVKKYKWYDSFIDVLSLLEAINKKYYPQDPPIFKELPLKNKNIKDSELPFFYSNLEILSIYKEMIKNHHYFPWFDFLYIFFTRIRFILTNKKRLPYYLHWFKFKDIGINLEHQKTPYEEIKK